VLTTRQKVKIARVLSRLVRRSRSLVTNGDYAEVERLGVRWRLDLKEGIDLAIYLGCYERETLGRYRNLVGNGAVVVDIGANMGVHSLYLANLVGASGHVHAVEPTRFAFDKLRDNLALNPDITGRVTATQCMLLASCETPLPDAVVSSWPVADEPVAETALGGIERSTSGAHVSTLDQMVAEWDSPSMELIKLDVDGYELDVLRGAQDTLAKYRPKIILELCPFLHHDHDHSFQELIDFIGSSGYGMRDLRHDQPLALDAQHLERSIPWGAGKNVLLLHN
jgi:FkbM family methyltransferase